MKEEQHPPRVIEIGDGASIPDPSDTRLITAWSVSFAGAVAAVFFLCVFYPDPYWTIMKFLPDGIIITFKITILGILAAIPIGFATGLGRLSGNRVINLAASIYVEVIRGIPLLVQLCFIYYGLGRVVRMPDLMAAVTAMAICYGAYMGEVFRAGISAIDRGQTEAARSLGFNRTETMLLVVLPQAWRTILPPVGNEFIALLKDTSLVSIMAMTNILQRGREYASRTYEVFETYLMVALLYLLITLLLSKGVSLMEARLNYYGRK
ncbi:MAG: amino acid ABC transporter permease [Deltaproteobacteria bacterium]|jgi:polar amino acid transport system permease protein|nr:amino acid ABC transporter permease [Deltaproteobacteria bacterium]